MSVSNFSFPLFSFRFLLIPKIVFHFAGTSTGNSGFRGDPRFKLILWSIVSGTRGGVNRAKILNLLRNTPLNANKIASSLKLDYKTVVHHVRILIKNDLIIKSEETYGGIYALSPIMEDNQNTLEEIMEKIGTK